MSRNHMLLVITVVVSAIVGGASPSKGISTEVVKGWVVNEVVLKDYEIRIDRQVFHSGKASAFVKLKESSSPTFGSFFQVISADEYRGKRVRFSGYVKTEGAEQGAALWLRLDAPHGITVGFDNMADRPIKGTTDWKEYQIVLDVPRVAESIFFGLLLSGKGRAWLDDVRLEPVDKSVPVTSEWAHLPYGWKRAAIYSKAYELGVDHKVFHGGKGSAFVAARSVKKGNVGALIHTLKTEGISGEKAYLSGYVKTKGADPGAQLMLAFTDIQRKVLSQNDMKSNPIQGTTDWKKYEISAEIPKESAYVHLAFSLHGKGKAWIDDVELTVSEKGKPSNQRELLAQYDFDHTVAEMARPLADSPNKQGEIPAAKQPINLGFESE